MPGLRIESASRRTSPDILYMYAPNQEPPPPLTQAGWVVARLGCRQRAWWCGKGALIGGSPCCHCPRCPLAASCRSRRVVVMVVVSWSRPAVAQSLALASDGQAWGGRRLAVRRRAAGGLWGLSGARDKHRPHARTWPRSLCSAHVACGAMQCVEQWRNVR